MSHVLVVDDEESICWSLERMLTDDGHDVAVASSAEEALESATRHPPDLIVLDVRLPGIDGLSAMQGLSRASRAAPIVVITAFGNLGTAVQAVRNGAFDYLSKPFDLDQASSVIARALASRQSEPAARSVASLETAASDEMLGASPAMQNVFKRIALIAPTEAAVLITGESGTGKELVARAIHRHSARAAGPLVPVNVAALSPTLVESELFGHVRGAFTGADVPHVGLLELAAGGTIFFDEVADIPPAVQVKLLRVLEQREVTPVGEARPRPVDFRVLAATHRDLRQEVRAGRFRADLYFRLAVFDIGVPALRERPDDITLLAERFLGQCGAADGIRLSGAVLDELRRRPWPGNVRELRNAVEHGALLARGGTVLPEHLPPPLPLDGPVGPSTGAALTAAVHAWSEEQLADTPRDLYEQFLSATEPALFAAVLEHTRQNRLAAADVLGIHRATLRKKLKNGD